MGIRFFCNPAMSDVMCDACHKWRDLPPGHPPLDNNLSWVCGDIGLSCSAPGDRWARCTDCDAWRKLPEEVEYPMQGVEWNCKEVGIRCDSSGGDVMLARPRVKKQTRKRGARHSVHKLPAKRKPRDVSFTRELPLIMYGFGDDSTPYVETVELLDTLVKDYMQRLLLDARRVKQLRGEWKKGPSELDPASESRIERLRASSIRHAVHRDAEKRDRVDVLLQVNEEISSTLKRRPHLTVAREIGANVKARE